MAFFGHFGRLLFCVFLLYSAYYEYKNRAGYSVDLLQNYQRFTKVVAKDYGITLPSKKVVGQHAEQIALVFIAVKAFTGFTIQSGIPYLGLIYTPFQILSLMVNNPFLTSGPKRGDQVIEFMKNLAVMGIVLMFSFPLKRRSAVAVSSEAQKEKLKSNEKAKQNDKKEQKEKPDSSRTKQGKNKKLKKE